jgi:hypothetical protein
MDESGVGPVKLEPLRSLVARLTKKGGVRGNSENDAEPEAALWQA